MRLITLILIDRETGETMEVLLFEHEDNALKAKAQLEALPNHPTEFKILKGETWTQDANYIKDALE